MNNTTPTTLKQLIACSVLYMIFVSIATDIAIAENRPAAFGGSSTGLPVVQDFLYGMGTAMSPPLIWLIAQVAFTILAPRGNR